MEWLQVIIEWINCLNVLDTPVKTINELQDKRLHEKLIKLSWKKDVNVSGNKDIVTVFIEDEYPEFRITKNKGQGYSEDIYIVSLLLSYASLNAAFHQPMCTKLPHEVQVKIKAFLEMVLSCGRSITIEILKDVIMDLGDSEKENLLKTPRMPSLKEFFSSPVARSAQNHRMINERNRELRQLKSELETERFEKADLQEDLRLEQNKVQNLLKQLEEKSTEVKALKGEKMKFATPQSCKKKNRLYNEDYYKKEINKLENQLIQCQDEVIKLEDQKNSIAKKLMFTEKRNISLIEKCNNLERSIETITADIETKERELINLKINNEDLRAHIKKLNRTSMEENSFEIEDIDAAHSFLSSLNTSETLSSVIDIQFQEAKNENSLLKTQITQLKEKLEITCNEHDNARQIIITLQNKVKMLDDIQNELSNAEEKILLLDETNKALQEENILLNNQCRSLENSLVNNNELILQAEQSKKELGLALHLLHKKVENVEKALNAETVKSSDLEHVISDQKKIIDDHSRVHDDNIVLKEKIEELEILEQKRKEEWEHELHSLHEKIENLDKALKAETVKSSDLEQVISDQKKIIDDHSRVHDDNIVLKEKIEELEILEQKRKEEWEHELHSLHEKIENLDKALKAETVKSSDLEHVISDQKKIIDDHSRVHNDNIVLKEKIDELEILEQKRKEEWEQELHSLHEKNENLNKALKAETVKSSDLEQVISDQKKIIDDHSRVHDDNIVLKEKIDELEILEQKRKEEWKHELHSLHEKIDNLDKALKAETVKSSDLEHVISDQKKIIDDHSRVHNDNIVLKEKIDELEILEQKRKEEWEQELHSLHEKNENLNKALKAETVKSSDLEQVISDQKKIIDDHSRVHDDNIVLKEKIDELEILEQKRKEEWKHELHSLHEKIDNLDKALKAETVKSSDLEHVISDQKKIIDDHSRVHNDNIVLKEKIDELEILELKRKEEWEHELHSLHEKIENLDKALKAETVKSSDLEHVISDQKKIIDDHSRVHNDNIVLKEKIDELEILEQKRKEEWEQELHSLHEKNENLNKALKAETVKSSDLEQVISDQKKIIDDHSRVHDDNIVLKEKIDELEILEQKRKEEWKHELHSLHEKIDNLDKALKAETVKSSDLEHVISDQKKIIDDHSRVHNDNIVLKEKIDELEILEQKRKEEWEQELHSLHEKNENLNKALKAETVKSSDLEQVISDQKKIIDDHSRVHDDNIVLKEKIDELEILEQKHKNYIQNVIEEKENLQELLSKFILSLGNFNDSVISLKQKWSEALTSFPKLTIPNNLKCQDVESLQTKKITIEKMLYEYDMNHIQIIKSIIDILWKRFKDPIQELANTYLKCSNDDKKSSFAEYHINTNHIKEKEIIEEELGNITNARNNIIKSEEEIETFMHLISSYEKNCLREQIEQDNNKQKLQLQIDQLAKEKKEIKNKLDIMRVRNAKLERTLEELRAEKKKIQEETKLTSHLTDLDNLRKEVALLKESNVLLQEEIDKLNKEPKEDVRKEISETQLKEIHTKYEMKLEERKQQMKVAYNEQVAKLNKEQEKVIQEKVEQFQLRLEQQCQKHKEEIAKYKTHVNELNSQFWNVGEKLLTAQQEKQELLLQVNELKIKLQNEVEQKPRRLSIYHKTIKSEKLENPFENSVQENSQIFSKGLTEDNTYEKQNSARNMHAMVNAFHAEDEEGEVFDNIYLADMKEGNCLSTVDLDRLSILRKRNSLCKPHLKSSYPAETQFQPLYFSEEEIKTGSVSEDMFNDSLSQILLPEQKTKKRDRTQTSYKKPGPPTPSKNGGRLSLHGNEIKSPNSRILKERNTERRAAATPRRNKGIFTLKRQDENVTGTPRARRLSNMFRKTRTTLS